MNLAVSFYSENVDGPQADLDSRKRKRILVKAIFPLGNCTLFKRPRSIYFTLDIKLHKLNLSKIRSVIQERSSSWKSMNKYTP